METSPRKAYPSDLTDDQWEMIAPLLPPARPGGRGRSVDLREIVNAVLYLTRSGCQWDMLPHDLPPKSTVYGYYAHWIEDGLWDHLLAVLRGAVRSGGDPEREIEPSAASIDSQTVKTSVRPTAATTAARKSQDKSDISRSIRWGCCSRWLSRPRASTTRPLRRWRSSG